MKLSKPVLYPIDEVYTFESEAMRASTWESASDVVHPRTSKFYAARQIAAVTGCHCTFSRRCPTVASASRIRFDLDEVMAWAKRWSRDMQDCLTSSSSA